MKFLLISIVFVFCFVGVFGGYLISNYQHPDFVKLSPEQMLEQITVQRAFAIEKAVKRGDYRCCISPACTMCFMEANQWNNWTAGTCACDDLIAQGKEPCPQCKRGIGDEEACGAETDVGVEEACKINLEI